MTAPEAQFLLCGDRQLPIMRLMSQDLPDGTQFQTELNKFS